MDAEGGSCVSVITKRQPRAQICERCVQRCSRLGAMRSIRHRRPSSPPSLRPSYPPHTRQVALDVGSWVCALARVAPGPPVHAHPGAPPHPTAQQQQRGWRHGWGPHLRRPPAPPVSTARSRRRQTLRVSLPASPSLPPPSCRVSPPTTTTMSRPAPVCGRARW